MKYLRWIFVSAIGLLTLGVSAWSALAVVYDLLPGVAGVIAAAVLLVPIPVLFLAGSRRIAPAYAAVLFGVVFSFWRGIEPSNTRDWKEDVAVIPRAEVRSKEVVEVKNVRNFNWRRTDDFDVRYENRRYDLEKLKTVDFLISYWGPRSIAHTMMSFGFGGDDYLAVSIETRKEKDEDFSAVKGFFRQYELCVVMADEKDVVRVRTNCRGEDVYLFRTNIAPESGRKLLRAMLGRAEKLAAEPEFYHALTNNCTNNVVLPALPEPIQEEPTAALDPKLIFNGYADEYVYDHGEFATKMPFDELKERSRITERAHAADQAPDFSRRIRSGLPTIDGEDIKDR